MKILTDIAHFVFGFLGCVSVIISPVLPILTTLLFIIYELDEEWHISDESYQDIFEYSVGWGAGLLLLIIHSVLEALHTI